MLRQRRRRRSPRRRHDPAAIVERVATFATGTPIANSLGELWVMQHYLRPDLLVDAGVDYIDAWGAAFTGTVSRIEMNATGSKLVPVTRVGKFVNLPELLALSAVFTDVVTRDQVPVSLPAAASAGNAASSPPPPATRSPTSSPTSATAHDHLDPRTPRIDNPLKIANDGRNVSLDPRLAHLAPPGEEGRAAAVAREILRIHDYSKDNRYLDEFGDPAPRPAARCRSCSATAAPPKPTPTQFTFYAALRDELVARGMDPRHDPVHPRRPHRRRTAAAAGRRPQRRRRGADRLHREDGHRHQRPDPGHRPAPRRRALAPGRPRTARRPDHPPRQPKRPRWRSSTTSPKAPTTR